jgi:hypothetical protein
MVGEKFQLVLVEILKYLWINFVKIEVNILLKKIDIIMEMDQS